MPDITRRDLIQLSVLLLCVPVQYFICTQWEPGSESRLKITKWFVTAIETLTESIFNAESWLLWAFGSIDEYMEEKVEISERRKELKPNSKTGESPAMEVIQYRLEKGYFASSTEVRSTKSKHILFGVGQAVKHKTLGYRGVIIGWDSVAKAPDSWLRRVYSREKQTKWREMANYAILVDTRDRSDPQTTYVAQELIELQQKEVTVQHPQLEDYFVEKVGKTYIARSWLRRRYPED